MHIAHRVTNTYPSSVQSTQFFWVQHSYMMANQQPLIGRYPVVSGMLQGEKHIQFRTHEKGMFYIFFSYNALLSLWFKIFPFTWEHFPVSFIYLSIFKFYFIFKLQNCISFAKYQKAPIIMLFCKAELHR